MKGLEAVELQHLEGRRRRAAEIVAAAREAAAQALASAEAEARSLIETATKEGDSTAEQDTSRDWIAARRKARGELLAAQRDSYRELRIRCTDAVVADPRCRELVREAGNNARRVLGPGADVTADGRTVTGTRKAIQVLWSVDQAVDQALGELGADIEGLWR